MSPGSNTWSRTVVRGLHVQGCCMGCLDMTRLIVHSVPYLFAVRHWCREYGVWNEHGTVPYRVRTPYTYVYSVLYNVLRRYRFAVLRCASTVRGEGPHHLCSVPHDSVQSAPALLFSEPKSLVRARCERVNAGLYHTEEVSTVRVRSRTLQLFAWVVQML